MHLREVFGKLVTFFGVWEMKAGKNQDLGAMYLKRWRPPSRTV